MKSKRHAEILRLVRERSIENQNQLLAALGESGIHTTQATISRDIRELNLVKLPGGNGGYRYVAAEEKRPHHSVSGRLRSIFEQGVTSWDVAQNIVVVKTMPGLASAAGAALDDMSVDGLVGSLAGDDTVLMIMRDNQAARDFQEEMDAMLRG